MELEKVQGMPIDAADLNKLVGHNVKALRLNAGLTREDLTELLGLKARAIEAIEQGRVGVKAAALIKLSSYFGVSIEEILGTVTELKETLKQTLRLENAIARLSQDGRVEKIEKSTGYKFIISIFEFKDGQGEIYERAFTFSTGESLVMFVDGMVRDALESDKTFGKILEMRVNQLLEFEKKKSTDAESVEK